jgi:hypothetical protein
VKQLFEPEQLPHRVQGAATRGGQVVGVDCSLAIVYDIKEATGPAVLAQSELVHLRTRSVPRGTSYKIDCMGPLIVEIPADASGFRATSRSASGAKVALPMQAPASVIPLAFGKRLLAEPRMQFVLVHWPRTPSADYTVELAFDLPRDRAIREKALYTVSVSCGGSSYLQPILPLVNSLARVGVFAIQPAAKPIRFSPPRIAGTIGAHTEATRALSCAR